MLGEQMEFPLRAKPMHYMNIYDGTNKTKPKEITRCLFQDVSFVVRPMPGSDKSASGTSGTCHCSRRGTAIRVAGTEDRLTRPDSENTSEPPEQVNQTRDQPEPKK